MQTSKNFKNTFIKLVDVVSNVDKLSKQDTFKNLISSIIKVLDKNKINHSKINFDIEFSDKEKLAVILDFLQNTIENNINTRRSMHEIKKSFYSQKDKQLKQQTFNVFFASINQLIDANVTEIQTYTSKFTNKIQTSYNVQIINPVNKKPLIIKVPSGNVSKNDSLIVGKSYKFLISNVVEDNMKNLVKIYLERVSGKFIKSLMKLYNSEISEGKINIDIERITGIGSFVHVTKGFNFFGDVINSCIGFKGEKLEKIKKEINEDIIITDGSNFIKFVSLFLKKFPHSIQQEENNKNEFLISADDCFKMYQLLVFKEKIISVFKLKNLHFEFLNLKNKKNNNTTIKK